MSRRQLASFGAFTVWVLASLCRSAYGDDEAGARVLYQEAHKLVAAGEVAKGCAKFEESLKLKENVNARFFLGDCLEKLGKTASAWSAFLSAASKAAADGEEEKASEARQRAAALEPKLGRLVIKIGAETKGLSVTRGEVRVGKAQLETPVPLDPGPITIHATAPGKRAWHTTVTLVPGSVITVTVPALEDAPPTSDAAPAAWERPDEGHWRAAAMVTGGVGVTLFAASMFVGWSARSRFAESNEQGRCIADRCDALGLTMRDEARARGNVATVLFAIGTSAILAGSVLYLASPKQRVSVGLGPTSLVLWGRF